MNLTRIVEIFEIHTGKFINIDVKTEIPEQKGFLSRWVLSMNQVQKYQRKEFSLFLEKFAQNKIMLKICSYYNNKHYEYCFRKEIRDSGTISTNDYIYNENSKQIYVKNVDFIFTKEFTKLIRPDLYQIQMDDLFIHFN